jgi:hypothetical protein
MMHQHLERQIDDTIDPLLRFRGGPDQNKVVDNLIEEMMASVNF